jgi:hypothetical protein
MKMSFQQSGIGIRVRMRISLKARQGFLQHMEKKDRIGFASLSFATIQKQYFNIQIYI